MIAQSSSLEELRSNKFNKKIANFLVRLQATLDIPEAEILDILKLNKSGFSKIINGTNELDLLRLCDLSTNYNFDLDALFNDRIDFETLRQHSFGNEDFISEKYKIGAFSKKRLLITIFDYIEKIYGWEIKESILKHFQLTKSIYSDPNGAINVFLFEDILAFTFKYGLTTKDICSIGHYSLLTTTETVLAKTLSLSESPKDLYELYFLDLIQYIEHNNKYKITSLTSESCEVVSHEINDNLDIFKVDHIGGPLRCLYRVGALQAATHYMGLPFAKVSEITCVHRGDKECKFLINYEFPIFQHKRKSQNTQSRSNIQTWKLQ